MFARLRLYLAHRRLDGLVDESIKHASWHRCAGAEPCHHWDGLQALISDAYDQLAKASK
jgi:hypothetical protein